MGVAVRLELARSSCVSNETGDNTAGHSLPHAAPRWGDSTPYRSTVPDQQPEAAASAGGVAADAILLTRGRRPHRRPVAIAKRTGATVVAITEIAGEIGEEGVEVVDTNLGGTAEFDWGSVRLTPAWHTSTTPMGTVSTPAGLVIEFGDKRIYHLGDTALFSDLALPRRRGHIDVALMCIGGHYTMDRFDAVVAAEYVGADQVIPCHYDTFPPIETDAQAFKSDVQNAAAPRLSSSSRARTRRPPPAVLIEAGARMSPPARSRPRRRGRGLWSPANGLRGHRACRATRCWPRSSGGWSSSRGQPHPDDGRLRVFSGARPRGDA